MAENGTEYEVEVRAPFRCDMQAVREAALREGKLPADRIDALLERLKVKSRVIVKRHLSEAKAERAAQLFRDIGLIAEPTPMFVLSNAAGQLPIEPVLCPTCHVPVIAEKHKTCPHCGAPLHPDAKAVSASAPTASAAPVPADSVTPPAPAARAVPPTPPSPPADLSLVPEETPPASDAAPPPGFEPTEVLPTSEPTLAPLPPRAAPRAVKRTPPVPPPAKPAAASMPEHRHHHRPPAEAPSAAVHQMSATRVTSFEQSIAAPAGFGRGWLLAVGVIGLAVGALIGGTVGWSRGTAGVEEQLSLAREEHKQEMESERRRHAAEIERVQKAADTEIQFARAAADQAVSAQRAMAAALAASSDLPHIPQVPDGVAGESPAP